MAIFDDRMFLSEKNEMNAGPVTTCFHCLRRFLSYAQKLLEVVLLGNQIFPEVLSAQTAASEMPVRCAVENREEDRIAHCLAQRLVEMP